MKFQDPFKILPPNERWAPSQSQMELHQNAYEKLLPPLVYKIRQAVFEWRNNNYDGASETTKTLLNFWFNKEHLIGQSKFQFFFSQREAIESIVYLYEVAKAHDKINYPLYDSSKRVSNGMFAETWTRYMVKMATGAGKTTITRLLLRQFDIPDGYGSITIGKVDIRDITQKELRQTLSYVSQDPSFPHRKIKEIIAFGKPDATMEEIVAAAKRASCHSFITEKLEKGYDTLVGERGVKLSGGQRQRLAIAAAFLKDAEILMLDEPTSALDTETENEVQMVLREMVGKTMLVIAHRLTTVAQLDEIIVIDGGRVYERGTHNELMNLPDGLYRSLWERQYANLEQN